MAWSLGAKLSPWNLTGPGAHKSLSGCGFNACHCTLGPFLLPVLTEQPGIALLTLQQTIPLSPCDGAPAALASWLGKEGASMFPSAEAACLLACNLSDSHSPRAASLPVTFEVSPGSLPPRRCLAAHCLQSLRHLCLPQCEHIWAHLGLAF